LDGRDLLGAIVKLEVHLLDSNQSAFREGRVRTALRGAYHLSIVRSVDRADRQRGRGFSTALSPLQNLSAYLERQQVPEARAKMLLELARRLVGEEEGAVEADVPQEPAPAVGEPAAEAETPGRPSRRQ
jgi:hypothetical protein